MARKWVRSEKRLDVVSVTGSSTAARSAVGGKHTHNYCRAHQHNADHERDHPEENKSKPVVIVILPIFTTDGGPAKVT